MTSYVAYYRVSTVAQARSGLGLEAQRDVIQRFVTPEHGLVAEFIEVQSGRRDDRVELRRALALAKASGSPLLIARLDRFSRRVSFISGIMDRGVRLVVAELPNATDFQLHIFAALAQEERRLTSERTRLALQRAKARGVRLGKNGPVLAARNRAEAQDFARKLMPVIDKIGADRPLAQIAAALNEAGYLTRRKRRFAPQTVKNLLNSAAGTTEARAHERRHHWIWNRWDVETT